MENEITEKKEKSFSAKLLSKITICFSGLWIAILTILKGLQKIDLQIDEIIYSGITITAIWCPTFISIYFDKIKAIKDMHK